MNTEMNTIKANVIVTYKNRPQDWFDVSMGFDPKDEFIDSIESLAMEMVMGISYFLETQMNAPLDDIWKISTASNIREIASSRGYGDSDWWDAKNGKFYWMDGMTESELDFIERECLFQFAVGASHIIPQEYEAEV